MSAPVAIIDYGLGNLHSVCKALRLLNCPYIIAKDPNDVAAAERVILPGVGAFGDGMAGLTERGHDAALKEVAKDNRPLLGICLGAQLLLDESEEFGHMFGLGLIPGKVTKIPQEGGVKVPHVGWQRIMPSQSYSWDSSILKGTDVGTFTYFVHSFHAIPYDPTHLLTITQYGSNTITAGVKMGSITGLQFHPEKSGIAGLNMLRNFITQ